MLEAGKSTAKTSKERIDVFEVHSADFKRVIEVLASRTEDDADAVTAKFIGLAEKADALAVALYASTNAKLVNNVIDEDEYNTYVAAVAIVEAGHKVYKGSSTTSNNFVRTATIIHGFAVNPNFEGRGYTHVHVNLNVVKNR